MGIRQNSSDSREHILRVGQQLIASKGFTAVGLAEILCRADVPKGSFYHYFASKEAFGVALLEEYFADYDHFMMTLFGRPRVRMVDNLIVYFEEWAQTQGTESSEARRCLVVKLASEVSDLSEAMRQVLERGTRHIIERLTRALEAAVCDGEMPAPSGGTAELADRLYMLWLGASVMAKIRHDSTPLQDTLGTTRLLLTGEKT